jgi:ABC-type branched-subunit amino acid transport system substrate-binding protein
MWRSMAVLAVSGIALAACGSGDDDASSGTSTGASSSSSASSSAVAGDGVLTIGTLLPQTGSLAFLGPPEFAGVDAAVADINAAGGVNGAQVVQQKGDSGDATTDIASQTVDRLLAAKADVIIGAASSSVSLTVIDKIKNAKVVEISPANTSDKFTNYKDDGYYFRTAPPDTLQGRVLSDLMAADGHSNIGILELQDPYSTGLGGHLTDNFQSGGGKVVSTAVYQPNASDYSAEVSKIKSSNPDAIALIGFEESKAVIAEMIKQGIGPDKIPLYLVDGNLANTLGDNLPAGILKGTKGTTPGAKSTDAFVAKLKATNPALTDFSYGPESYDAAILTALAAEEAKSDSGTAIRDHLMDVSTGGTKCTDFAACKKLIDAGTDVDYDGVSGPIEFNKAGDPSDATIGIYQYGADNKYTNIGYQEGKI